MVREVALVLLDKTIEVAAAPSRVFALLADAARAPRWQPWTLAAATADGRPLRDGSRLRMVHEALGMRFAWTGIAEVEEGRRVAFRKTSGDFAAMDGAWEVEPAGAGARVHLRLHVALPFVLPRFVTEAEATHELSGALDAAMFSLKDVLEGAS